MLQTHNRPNGQKILIAEMSDRDLFETVDAILNTAIQAKDSIQTNLDNAYRSALYGITPADPKAVADVIRGALTRSYPYLVECYFRGITSATDVINNLVDDVEKRQLDNAYEKEDTLIQKLQKITEREGRLETNTQLLLNPVGMAFAQDNSYSAQVVVDRKHYKKP